MRDRIRGWFRSSNSGDGEPERVKTNFDGLFSDMPGINDILGDGTSGNEQENDNTQTKKSRSSEQDYAWFEEEKQKIIRSYEGILNDMLENLQSQRLEDPESVPDNAEAMIKSVLKQEMDTELKETQEKRAMERLDSYEKTERTRVDEEDVSGPVTDSRVQRLIDESEQEYERQMKAQLELDEFLKYEEEAIVKTQKPDTSTDITMPEPNANLDQWALERLEEMAQAKEDLGADEVLDILDDNLQDLKDRMEKESARGSLQPETMKEWQMYRAIATRLGASVDASGKVVKNVASDGQTITDEDIFLRLQSWKEYNEKEIGVREKGGLSRGPRLPFEWQELSDSGARKISGTKASRMETRKQINRMSIEALESLMVSSDAARREKLQNEIDYLKRELEDKDYLDWEEPDDFEDVTGPVDLSDVFSSSSVETKKPDEKVEVKPVPPEAASPPVVEDSSGTPPPPNTPFFSDSEPEASTISPKPPSTPFFSDDESVDMKVADTDSKLGGMDEQNLENMFRKAGARTKEERDRIRAGYEEFKRVEEEKRKASGLEGSDYNFSEYEVKYNVSEVMLDGGDFDAQKILSSIGPRPKRVKKKTEDSESVQDPALKSSIDEKDVAASLYRSVSAAGGGRFKDDPSGEASFMDFLEQEKSMRETVDNIPDDQLSVDSSEGGFDDEEYADRAMSEIGPRPVTKKYNRVDEGYLSDNSGRLAGDDFSDDSEDEGENDISMQDDETAAFDEDIPEWVKQEREARDNPRRKTFLSANDIEDSFPDDEYEHNMRQLAEYERRRAGKEPRQMGIDISDVLGPRRRQDFETDDYKDYKYDDDYYHGTRVGWGQTTFDTRKRDLLEYTELDVPLLNALMEQRDAVSSSGVSRYMAKINKPFKEFGAIFRLEGVVADISGLQAKAWKKTAESLGTRAPILDEVKMAAVLRPEYAISDIFGWTTDVYEMQQIAAKYQDFFAEDFNEWADSQGLGSEGAKDEDTALPERGSLALGEELFDDARVPSTSTEILSESEMLTLLMQSWGETASRFRYPRPNQDQLVAAASMEADLAVSEVFRWTSDPLLVDDIAAFQRRTMETLRKGGDISSTKIEQPRERISTDPPKQSVLDQNTLMELHYKAWIDVASKYGYDQPTADEVLSAFVLNDPALVVKGGFGWTSDTDVAQEVAQGFTESLRALLNNPSDTVYGQVVEKPKIEADETLGEEEATSSSGPSFNDILSMHSEAWVSTSRAFGYSPPTLDQVKLSVNMEPSDFVERIMRWSSDPALTRPIETSFRDALKVSSQSLLQKLGYATSPQEAVDETIKAEKKPSTTIPEDLYDAAYEAWNSVASRFRLPPPTTDQILYAMSVGPEDAIQFGFRWTDDEGNMAELLKSYREVIAEKRPNWAPTESDDFGDSSAVDDIPLVQVSVGADKWIESLMDVEMECGVISHLTRSQMDKLLEYAGIADLIDPERRVPAASNSGRLFPTVKHYFDSQQMLAAALRVERRPDHCVVIDASPGASLAARSVEMQSVAWIGSFPRYELLQADSTVSRLDELTAMNIRRLFGERIFDQPLLDQQQADPEIKKKIKTKFNWDD